MVRSRRVRVVVGLALVGLILAGPSLDASAARSPTRYIPPVPAAVAVITDHFRLPPTPYAAGNRGLDYSTVPGSVVVAAASGQVVFAGSVGNTLHVTIAHTDGLRTSYSFLAQILVARGDRVEQSEPIGIAGPRLHFGVRDASGTYLDPEGLFAGPLGAHLVPGPDEGAAPLGSEAEDERRDFALVVAADQRARRRASGAARIIDPAADPAMSILRLGLEVDRWQRAQARCGPEGVTCAPRAEGLRRLIAGHVLELTAPGLGPSLDAAMAAIRLAGLRRGP
jgi:murein DD-endopeptidase MepM/ murein hydrolase activator NlpD